MKEALADVAPGGEPQRRRRVGAVVACVVTVVLVAAGALILGFGGVFGDDVEARDRTAPVLRTVPVRKVFPAVYADGEATQTVSTPGWPLAFRVPATWVCADDLYEFKIGQARRCTDERGGRLQIAISECPAPCGLAERTRFKTENYGENANRQTFDESTTFNEKADESYSLDLSRFFIAADNSPWHVAVYGQTAPTDKPTLQKAANEIASQAG